ncbi:hypothetical protein [Pseudomonas taetrolens]|uniref:hypothetical protein n=1 Tax=Pseudomonas taetrolens TaxID=47884 RepID=UPI00138E01DC|nr:hypothetical protein [Pseudomonas taetrolens]
MIIQSPQSITPRKPGTDAGIYRQRAGGCFPLANGLRTFLADNKLIHMTANFTNSDAISNVKGGIDTTNAHQSPNKKIK